MRVFEDGRQEVWDVTKAAAAGQQPLHRCAVTRSLPACCPAHEPGMGICCHPPPPSHPLLQQLFLWSAFKHCHCHTVTLTLYQTGNSHPLLQQEVSLEGSHVPVEAPCVIMSQHVTPALSTAPGATPCCEGPSLKDQPVAGGGRGRRLEGDLTGQATWEG